MFDNLNLFSIAALLAGCAVFLLLAYNVGAFLCRMIWGESSLAKKLLLTHHNYRLIQPHVLFVAVLKKGKKVS